MQFLRFHPESPGSVVDARGGSVERRANVSPENTGERLPWPNVISQWALIRRRFPEMTSMADGFV
jgi:hypothetical protein